MSVEMSHIGISKIENGSIYGLFHLKNYNNLRIEFEYKKGEVFFTHHIRNMNDVDFFYEWRSKEKDDYTLFLLHYFNEVYRFNDIPFFNGRIVEEFLSYELGVKKHIIKVKYDEIPTTATFEFSLEQQIYFLLCHVPIPMNSEGIHAGGIYVKGIHKEDFLSQETIQRMWEPFRDKTKYKLDLFYMLR